MFLRVLLVLMWRHWRSRVKRFICSIFELGLPLLFFYAVFAQRADLAAAFENEKEEPKSLRFSSDDHIMDPSLVFYTPETGFTKVLMSLVAQKLRLELLTTLPDKLYTNVKGYLPFGKVNSIIHYPKNMGLDEAVVVFHDISESAMPDRLNYSIRIKAPLKAYKSLGNQSTSALVKPYDGAYESFLALQWAIDSSFIQMLTGKEVKQEVTLQEFPRATRDDIKKNKPALKKAISIYLMCDFGMIIIFYVFTSRMLAERASGVQELMKMMGVSSSALVLSHVLNSCVSGLLYALAATAMSKLGTNALLGKSNGFLLFLAYFLHFLSLIAAGAVVTYLGNKAPNITVTVLLSYVVITLPAFISLIRVPPEAVVIPCGLIFVVPLIWCLTEASILELSTGLNFKTMMSSHQLRTGPVILAYIFFLIQIVICFILCWYLERVTAGAYGTSLPWNFLCQKAYWSKSTAEPNVETQATQVHDQKYFEPPSGNLKAGIRVINVTKDFPKNPGALDNISLDIYKGEITILLGHNGAGKTTLISVITGMTNATKGKVLVNGLDIMTQKVKARKYIGLCPQQNMFLRDLSVLEHVMFFTLIKRGTFRQARNSARELLRKLNIEDKQSSDTADLSGGMKRRVQLACALAGDASVLLLDEPTSGLDVQTRRSLWDLLLSFRGSRTVLLSTHFMEEADALGDRVAALSTGRLRCHATPMYLKRAMDLGYRLNLTTTGVPNEAAITSTIKSEIPEAEIRETGPNTISYNLPLENTNKFPKLFAKMEGTKSELGLETIGVGVSTLEEVFLKLCSGTEQDVKLNKNYAAYKALTYRKLTGAPLCRRQIVALFKRYLRFLWVFKYTQIFFGIIIVMISILLITFVSNDQKDESEQKNVKGIDVEKPSPSTPNSSRVLFKLKGSAPDMRRFSDQYPKIHFENVSEINEAVFRASQRDLKHGKYLAAIEVNDTHAKVFYINSDRHGAVAILNLLSNLLAARAHLRNGGRLITVLDDPLPGAYTPYTSTSFKLPKSEINRALWSFMIVFFILLGISCLAMMPSREYYTGARIRHLMAGCSPELHWGITMLTMTLQVLLTYCLALAIACTAIERDKTFSDADFIIAVLVVVLLATVAILAFTFMITFKYSPNATMRMAAAMLLLALIIIPSIVEAFNAEFLKTICRFVLPQYTFLVAIENSVTAASLNALCKLNRDKCPLADIFSYDGNKCCGSQSNPVSYFGSLAARKEMLILTGQVIVYVVCLLSRQRGYCSLMWEKVVNRGYKPPVLRYNDDSVIKTEKIYVEETIGRPTKRNPDVMLVSDVHKNYRGFCFWKSFNAVKGVSFSVKKGECFGLLGMNGAGKSSMFQMLAVDHSATRGQIFVNGHYLKIPCIDEYLKSLSYCPQFWGLSDFLTGRQNLSLLLTFGGLNKHDADTEAMTWIRLIDLEKYANRIVTEYSGGCLRRLSAAAALCTGAPVTMLDEPTAGVDVSARRLVWAGIQRVMAEQRAIIITSHSLDEMEVLCHRIAIMAAGEVRALGSPSGLRASYAVGHTIIFKLNHINDKTSEKLVRQLKRSIQNRFNCTLKDEHKTMLHYHINETMQYSELFEAIEDIKWSFPEVVEDYSVSETTLEEVFITLAKAQEPPKEQYEELHKKVIINESKNQLLEINDQEKKNEKQVDRGGPHV